MSDADSNVRLSAGRYPPAFEDFTNTYGRELLVHCYRILGSLEDAEDALQETWLRAWRHLHTFEGRAPLRAWLYKIATNAALDALSNRRVRSLPRFSLPPADVNAVHSPAVESVWIEPFPNALLAAPQASPEMLYESHESLNLTFLAVLQFLPGRQRAALLLRDGLGWSVPEVAEMLETSVSAINSALQRARATMKSHGVAHLHQGPEFVPDDRTAALLTRYVQAWESADIPALTALLREDAAMSMPPLPQWYRGRVDIAAFLATIFASGERPAHFRLVATRANDAPAFAVYQRDEAGIYRPSSLQILTVIGDHVAAIDSFLALDSRLFARFQLPPSV
jgi:RNA polymerase sigma-70 factor (ECF subfamily)